MKTTSTFTTTEIKNFVNGINKTQFGLSAVLVTEPRLRAPKSCPFSGRVKKVAYYCGFTFASYANTINGASAAKSGATADFKADTPSYAHYVEGMANVLLQSNKDESQYYLALTGKEANMTIKTTYLVDGHVATPEEMASLAEWLYQPSKVSAKQIDHGILPEQVVWRLQPKLQNVVCITDQPSEAKEVYAELTK